MEQLLVPHFYMTVKCKTTVLKIKSELVMCGSSLAPNMIFRVNESLEMLKYIKNVNSVGLDGSLNKIL